MISLAPQQAAGLDLAAKWFKQCQFERGRLSQPIFRIFGYAGTGKTTITKRLAELTGASVVYAAFTGKAALMMERNGCYGASTIHGLIYQVKDHGDGSVRFVWDADSAAKTAGLIVIDECSMVDEELAADLMRYGRPILVLGDPAQLPPVKGAGYFINAEPDVMLTEIHRQAADNPIIRMATIVREGGALDYGDYGESRVIQRGVLSPEEVSKAEQVLVGKNATRRSYNARLRGVLGFTGLEPQVGDKLVCLKNDKPLGIFNGGLFRAVEIDAGDNRHVSFWAASEDFPNRAPVECKVRREFFSGSADDIPWHELRGTQQFDYGYALTCHKSQGSQWDDVIAYDESQTFRDDAAKWLYTAITRAAKTITVVR